MKQSKKHRFTHQDPEKLSTVKSKVENPVNSKLLNAEGLTIQKDLKGVLLNILFFATLLALFYIVNSRYNLLESASRIIGF